MGNANNIEISPVNVYWRMQQVDEIDFTGLTGLDVKGGSFNMSTAEDALSHYVWFDDSTEADPAISGRTGIAVTVTGDDDTAQELATACATAVDLISGYRAVADGKKVYITRELVGEVTAPVDTDSGVTITQIRKGRDFDLGYLQGDIVPNFAPANLVIQSHQTGRTPLASLNQGFETIEVTTDLLETDSAKLKELYALYGGEFTPASGTEIFGAGSSKIGYNLLLDAARLVLKPVNATDNTENTNIMLAVPVPGSLTFSGENPKILNVTWQGFIDTRFNAKANALAFGDVFQDGVDA